jgi:hypothetical protein
MPDLSRRTRIVVGDWYGQLLAVLLVLALVGSWVSYTTHVAPGTETEPRQVAEWDSPDRFTHNATVRANNSLYSRGTTLRNRSVYFRELTPRLRGAYHVGIDTTAAATVNTTVTLSLVLREVEREERAGNRTVIWREQRELATVRRTLKPGEQLAVPFTVDLRAVANRTARIHRQIGEAPGETEVLLHATVSFDGQVAGERVEQRRTRSLELGFTPGTYRVSGDAVRHHRRALTEQAAVERRHGPLRTVGGPLLLLVALAGLGGVVAVGSDPLTPTEQASLDHRMRHEEFSEWISRVTLPDAVDDRPRAEAHSLTALADVAIDTDERVLFDPEHGRYVVLADGLCYVYEPPQGVDPDEIETARVDSADAEVETDESPTVVDQVLRAIAALGPDFEAEWDAFETERDGSKAEDDRASTESDAGRERAGMRTIEPEGETGESEEETGESEEETGEPEEETGESEEETGESEEETDESEEETGESS